MSPVLFMFLLGKMNSEKIVPRLTRCRKLQLYTEFVTGFVSIDFTFGNLFAQTDERFGKLVAIFIFYLRVLSQFDSPKNQFR